MFFGGSWASLVGPSCRENTPVSLHEEVVTRGVNGGLDGGERDCQEDGGGSSSHVVLK